MPPVPTGCQPSEIARPELGDVGGGGQQGAARERAAAEQPAAGDQRDEQQESEEDGAGLAGDPLEPGELLDLQEVGVVAAGSGLDRAAVPSAGGVGVGAAAEVARDLFGGGPHGGAGRREERPQFARVDRRAAAPAPARRGSARARSRVPKRPRDLVDGLAGDLADEVGEGAQQGAEDEPEQDVRQLRAAGVGEQRVDGAGLVDAVRAGDGAARAVDGAALAGGGLGVPEDGVGGDEDAVAGGLGAPAQVDVVAHQGQPPVEAAELLEDVAADQHAGGGDGEHGRTWSCWPWSCSRRSRPVQRRPLLAMVTPTSSSCLRSYQPRSLGPTTAAYGGSGVGDAQQLGEGVGLGGAVVVQQPQPLDGLAVRELGQVVRVVAPAAGDRVPAAGALEVRQVVRGEHARACGRPPRRPCRSRCGGRGAGPGRRRGRR